MGLDMYLERYTRFKDTTPQQICAVENLLSWRHRPQKYKKDSLERWSGMKKSDLPAKEVIDFYAPLYIHRHSYWDTDKQFGFDRISESVGYWRKANAIHRWFVENVQDGEDDCDYHREVTAEDLKELRALCIDVVENSPMMAGKIQNGYHFVNGEMQPCMEDGKLVIDPSYAEELLPTESGFFFGGTNYDEYYIADLVETIKICNEVLESTDFDTQMVYYRASW